MYILRQVPGDIVVLDTAEGHGETRRRLAAFLASKDQAIEIAAAGHCPLDPDVEALRLFKTSGTAPYQVAARRDPSKQRRGPMTQWRSTWAVAAGAGSVQSSGSTTRRP